MTDLLDKFNQIEIKFIQNKLKQLTCNCNWCKICIERCDNEYILNMLNFTINTEQFELSNLLNNILLERKNKNIIYTKEFKNNLLLKQKEIYKQLNNII